MALFVREGSVQLKVVILGGGLSALSLAFFLQENPNFESIEILEKEPEVGGLCKSFQYQSLFYDIGPHIIFSKDEEILNLIYEIMGDNRETLRRSNQIIYQDRFIQYPFENDLSKLPEPDLNYCVNAFMNNPYENYNPQNMLQFFLKTFGEGITNTYLRPYNEKIWKFDPSFMDLQMVERIPKPPREDIIKSAQGETIDGYTHQLYFSYPQEKGINSLINSLLTRLNEKVKISPNITINAISKTDKGYNIITNEAEIPADLLISTIPVPELIGYYQQITDEITELGKKLRYNNLIIALINLKVDRAGENFVFTIPDKIVIFHRIAKLDFLGSNYHLEDSTTFLAEISYRNADLIDQMSDEDIEQRIIAGLKRIAFIDSESDINFIQCHRVDHCYIIYDLDHCQNMDQIIQFFQEEEVILHGRFGEWEYINMDVVFRK